MRSYLRTVGSVAVFLVWFAVVVACLLLPLYLASTVSLWWLFGYCLLPFVCALGAWAYERDR